MKYLVKTKQWILSRVSPNYPRDPELLTIIRESFKEWQTVKNQFNFVEPGMMEYMIHRLNAAEKHYTTLLAQARSEGLKAWPDNLRNEIRAIQQ